MNQVTKRSDSPRVQRSTTPSSTDRPSSVGWGRDLISLLLFCHVFCVVIVLSANLTPSSLQRRLVVLVAPYTRLLNFDPNFTRFQLTHGIEEHDDHVLEVVQAGQGSPETLIARFPDGTRHFRGGLPFGRYRNLADMFAFHAYRELDDVTAELARAIGAHVIKRMPEPSAVVVRCRWHRAQPLDLRESGELNPADPQAPEYWETIYEADVFLDDDGSPQLVKRASRREVAPSRQGA